MIINSQPDCGRTNGSVSVIVSGADGPIVFSWGDSNTNTDLGAGEKVVTVTNQATGCMIVVNFLLEEMCDSTTVDPVNPVDTSMVDTTIVNPPNPVDTSMVDTTIVNPPNPVDTSMVDTTMVDPTPDEGPPTNCTVVNITTTLPIGEVREFCPQLPDDFGDSIAITGPNGATTGLLDIGSYVIDPCLLYTSPSPRDKRQSRMPSSA